MQGGCSTMRPMPESDFLLAAARALPKVLLHEHLDGGLRVGTLFELMRSAGVASPAPDVASLAAWFDANAHAGSLTKYLEGFALTVAVMASPEAMARVAFEAAEDARVDGAVLAEFRIAPLLFEPHGVPGDAAVEALLAGLRRSGLPSGLIVCAMRHLPASETVRAAELALRFQGRGVVGFDLAGPEHGFPPHTGAARSVASHPITVLWRAGVSLSYHTDNRLMSCISLAGEAAALLRDTPLTEADLLAMALQAARASFLGAMQREAGEAAIRAFAGARGVALPA